MTENEGHCELREVCPHVRALELRLKHQNEMIGEFIQNTKEITNIGIKFMQAHEKVKT